MDIRIDTSVSFLFSGGRKATLDAYDLSEWHDKLWADHGVDPPEGAKPPHDQRTLSWSVILPAMTAYFKEHGGVELRQPEAEGIWEHLAGLWQKKRASWRAPAPAEGSPGSPGSIPELDPRSPEAD